MTESTPKNTVAGDRRRPDIVDVDIQVGTGMATAPGQSMPKLPQSPQAEPVDRQKTSKARRYSFYPDGKDIVLLCVQRDPSGQPLKNGALTAIPNTPRFTSFVEAKKWIYSSGEKLQGLTILIVKMGRKISVNVENKPRVSVQEDHRFRAEPEESNDPELGKEEVNDAG